MNAAGMFVEEDAGPGHLTGFVVVIRDHVKQFLFVAAAARRSSSENEKRLSGFLAVNCDRLVLLRISGKSPAVFIFIFVLGGLIVVPDPAIAFVAFELAARHGRIRKVGRRRGGDSQVRKQ